MICDSARSRSNRLRIEMYWKIEFERLSSIYTTQKSSDRVSIVQHNYTFMTELLVLSPAFIYAPVL